MGILNFFKKKPNTREKSYLAFEAWLDGVLAHGLPDSVIAVNFNFYEGSEQTYDIQLVGSDEFDEEDEDWACSEVFTTGENLCFIPITKDISNWEDGLVAISDMIKRYLEQGKHASLLKQYVAVGAGFVDGNLDILYRMK